MAILIPGEEPICRPQQNGEPIPKRVSFRCSDSIAAIAAAMAKAQGEIVHAKKDSRNPFFKSSYADLASIWEAIRKPFSANGLAIVQFPRTNGGTAEVETLIAHSSGEWMADTLALPVTKPDAQGCGSAITYARRYSLQSFAGVAAEEDDDGNAAAGKGNGKTDVQSAGTAVTYARAAILTKLQDAASQGLPILETVWKGMTNEQREWCKGNLPDLKKQAAAVVREPGEEG